MSFVHLHNRSHFSLLQGLASPQSLAGRAAQFGMNALALTDHNAMYGAVPFYKACREAGVQPILGLEISVAGGDELVLLATNMAGYRSLSRLASIAGQTRSAGQPPPGISIDTLREEREGLIALSGGRRALIPRLVRAGKIPQASRLIGAYGALFGEGNFYLELIDHGGSDASTVHELARLAEALGIPAVAANDALAAEPADTTHAALLDAIRTRTTLAAPHQDKSEYAAERYLKSPKQMGQLFVDYPQALANSRYIAHRCELELPLGTRRFPGVTLRPRDSAFSRLYKRAFSGVVRRYQPLTPEVTARLERELRVIGELGFAPYFLIVSDLVRWCREQGIPVMGRGSAADSMVSYVLDITPVDPLEHNLYFERFLNAERPEPPDIDLDLCWRRRDEVLNHVYEVYGREHVAMISTHIRFKLRSAWRDVAKAHGLPPAELAALAARPWGYDLEEAEAEAAADGEDEWSEEDPDWGELYPPAAETGHGGLDEDALPPLDPEVLAGCAALDNVPRHLGIHCGGIVISPFPLTDEVPVQRSTKGITITQYEMNAIEELGLVKIDLLGSRALSTLTATAARVIQNGHALDLDTIPFDDPPTYAMLAAGGTLGCFQLESPGMRSLLKSMKPRRLDDVIAAISLFRPGPLKGALKDIFLARLRSGTKPQYAHPGMAEVLDSTYGVVVFQEQFLLLMHKLAGFSLGQAERLRKRLMKSPDAAQRAALRAEFVSGAIGRDVPQALAEGIWEQLAANAGFGFCKGHAASYGVLAYRTAYCKAHYPAELLAALLDNEAGFYPPQVYIEEARRLSIELRGPDVNASSADTRAWGRSIQLGLAAVKGMRGDNVTALLAARQDRGPFSSLADLLSRVPLLPAEVQRLIQVGALDKIATGRAREELLWQARLWLPVIERERGATHRNGQETLALREALLQLPPDMPQLRPYNQAEELALERAALGFTISANPMAPYSDPLARYKPVPANKLVTEKADSVVVAGLPVAVRRHLTKLGQWMMFLTLQDESDLCEVVVMPDQYEAALRAVAVDGPLLVRGRREIADHGGVILKAEKLRGLRQ